MKPQKLIKLIIDHFSGDLNRDKQLRAEWFVREFRSGIERMNSLSFLDEYKRESRITNHIFNYMDLSTFGLAAATIYYGLGILLVTEGFRFLMNRNYKKTLDDYIASEQKEIGFLKNIPEYLHQEPEDSS